MDEVDNVKVTATKNGPIHIKGPVLFKDSSCGCKAVKSVEETDIWLCRCGHSENKPYCDGSHKRVGYRDTHTKNSHT